MQKFMLLIVGGVSIALSGCQPADPMPSNLAVPSIDQCEIAGGSIEKTGITRTERCLVPTQDAGKICRDSAGCEGRCLVEDWEGEDPPTVGTRAEGRCEASNLTYGCYAEVRSGRIASGFICVD